MASLYIFYKNIFLHISCRYICSKLEEVTKDFIIFGSMSEKLFKYYSPLIINVIELLYDRRIESV